MVTTVFAVGLHVHCLASCGLPIKSLEDVIVLVESRKWIEFKIILFQSHLVKTSLWRFWLYWVGNNWWPVWSILVKVIYTSGLEYSKIHEKPSQQLLAPLVWWTISFHSGDIRRQRFEKMHYDEPWTWWNVQLVHFRRNSAVHNNQMINSIGSLSWRSKPSFSRSRSSVTGRPRLLQTLHHLKNYGKTLIYSCVRAMMLAYHPLMTPSKLLSSWITSMNRFNRSEDPPIVLQIRCMQQSGFSLDSFQPITAAHVIELIAMAPNKHCALDLAPTSLIKNSSSTLAPFITVVFNHTLSGSLPTSYTDVSFNLFSA